MTRIPINPELLIRARERAGSDALALMGRFPKLAKWESGDVQPTLKQLEDFARAVHVPLGHERYRQTGCLGAEMLPLKNKRPRRIRRGQLPTGNPQSMNYAAKPSCRQQRQQAASMLRRGSAR